jgi:ABC-type bacteriocin/lantibiotic exporter with double-glycine peptidase domain
MMLFLIRAYKQLVRELPPGASFFLSTNMIFSSLLALIDMVALGLLAYSMAGLVSGAPVVLPLVGAVPEDGYVGLVLLIALLIATKSILAMFIVWVSSTRFARYELEIGQRLLMGYLTSPWGRFAKRSPAELIRSVDVIVNTAIFGFVAPLVGFPALLSTFVAVFIVLLATQPLTALLTITYLGVVGSVMYLFVAKKSRQNGRTNFEYSNVVVTLISEVLATLKELVLRDKLEEVGKIVEKNRAKITRARGHSTVLISLPRFIGEISMIGGFVLIGGVSFVTGGAASAVAAIAVFALAGFRLVPALSSMQASLAQMANSLIAVESVLSELRSSREHFQDIEPLDVSEMPIGGESVNLRGVGYTYEDADGPPTLSNMNLDIPFGSSLGIVGASGAGKSTLSDLLLGLREPTEGTIQIAGVSIREFARAWKRSVGYVPQEIAIFNGSIAQNVALSWGDSIDLEQVEAVLQASDLLEFVRSLPDGLQTKVGVDGSTLSGGQRQRLGVARALFNQPTFIVMDEATSSLDNKTESNLAASLMAMSGKITVVSIAHRLSSLKNFDQICLLHRGEIESIGTFEDVLRASPRFAEQVALGRLD